MVPRCAPSVLFALADDRLLDYMQSDGGANRRPLGGRRPPLMAGGPIMEMVPQAQRKRGPTGDDDVQDDMAAAAAPSAAAPSAKQPVVRKYFPETWLWHSAAVAYAFPSRSSHFPSAPLLPQPAFRSFTAALIHYPPPTQRGATDSTKRATHSHNTSADPLFVIDCGLIFCCMLCDLMMCCSFQKFLFVVWCTLLIFPQLHEFNCSKLF